MKRAAIVFVVIASVLGYLVLRRPSEKIEAASEHRETQIVGPAPSASRPVEVNVFGTIRSPGKLMLSRPSLAEALTHTVPYILSDMKRIRVYRMEYGVRIKDTVVDATHIMEPGGVDVVLEHGDTVYVPEKII